MRISDWSSDVCSSDLYLIVHADPAQPQAYAEAQRRLDALVYRLRQGGASYPQLTQSIALDEGDFKSSFTKEEFEAMVERAKEYIRAGDIFQEIGRASCRERVCPYV